MIRFIYLATVFVILPELVLAQSQRPRDGNLKVGELAPDFTVKDVDAKKTVKLSDLKGKPVVLIFGSCT